MRDTKETKPAPFQTMHEMIFGFPTAPVSKIQTAELQLEIAIEALKRAQANLTDVFGSSTVQEAASKAMTEARVAKARLAIVAKRTP